MRNLVRSGRWRIGIFIVCFVVVESCIQPPVSPASIFVGDDEVSSGKPGNRYALLIGCSKYPENRSIPELRSPENDVEAWRKFLVESSRTRFLPERIKILSGWKTEPQSRPSKSNIEAAFHELIGRANPGDRIFVMMSGHGGQFPIPMNQDPFDPDNFEPDGYDEVFLPSDYHGRDHIRDQVIKDEDISAWALAMKAKGAHVFLVLDYCHSGTMSRFGASERSRELRRRLFGSAQISQENRFGQPGGRSADDSSGKNAPEHSRIARGSIAVFFSSQSFQESIEMPSKGQVDPSRRKYASILSETLLRILESSSSNMTYRELSHRMASQDFETRGERPPFPFCEGDLDRQVFGSSISKRQSLGSLHRHANDLVMLGGELDGVSTGTIMSVNQNGTRSEDDTKVIGFVRVTEITDLYSIVEPVKFDGKEAIVKFDVPEFASCFPLRELVAPERVKVHVLKSQEVSSLIAKMPRRLKSMVNFEVAVDDADWVIGAVPDFMSKSVGQNRETKPNDLGLIQNCLDSKDLVALSSGSVRSMRTEENVFRSGVIRKFYRRSDDTRNAIEISEDLERIAYWQRIWRNAIKDSQHDAARSALRLNSVITPAGSKPDQFEAAANKVVHEGDEIRFELMNNAQRDYWITCVHVDPNLGIETLFSGALMSGSKFKPFGMKMKTECFSFGNHALIVFVVPLSRWNILFDFSRIEQFPSLLEIENAESHRVPSFLGSIEAGLKTERGPLRKEDKRRVFEGHFKLIQSWRFTKSIQN